MLPQAFLLSLTACSPLTGNPLTDGPPCHRQAFGTKPEFCIFNA